MQLKPMALLLTGNMQVLTDHEHKAMLWRDGFEIYYPDGIDAEDYCVLKFTAEKGNYYHGLENTDFVLEDFKNTWIWYKKSAFFTQQVILIGTYDSDGEERFAPISCK